LSARCRSGPQIPHGDGLAGVSPTRLVISGHARGATLQCLNQAGDSATNKSKGSFDGACTGEHIAGMFETAELGHTLDAATYQTNLPQLREQLLEVQQQVLNAASFPVILVFGGVAGAGKGETVNTLTEWMDPRFMEVHAMGPASDEERQRPPMWRFWRRLPAKGRIGVFFSSWYSDCIEPRALAKRAEPEFLAALAEILRFERMLADEGAHILKFWFHLSRQAQERRLDELWADKQTRFRVSKQDWKQLARYEQYRSTSARALSETDRPHAPWLVIEGRDHRYRSWNTGEALLSSLQRRLRSGPPIAEPAAPHPKIERLPIVSTLDLTRRLEPDDYERKLARLQRRLAVLTRHRRFERLSPVLVFEGVDAAGKGGAIRRVTRALDARLYEVHAVAAPTDEEKRQPYLWRFWRHLPRDGKFAIFDRSWYGRVLVERVEGLASEADWLRAYGEINDFEEQLARAGNVVVKFWLQISKEEQLRRFREREQTRFKHFKITAEDWRNREKWADYEHAASEMIERTSTEQAPWTLVEAEDKRFARIKVLKTIVAAVERARDASP
jgi:AMP-polyphosphate phosphotransferase